MALKTKTISDTGERGHHKFTLTVNENSVSTTNNTSSLSFTFKMSPVVTGYNWSSYSNMKYTITIGTKTYSGSLPSSYNGSSTVTIVSKSGISIVHNNDGSKTKMTIAFTVTDPNSSVKYTPGTASAKGEMDLTKIARAATLSIDGSPTTIELGQHLDLRWPSISSFSYTVSATLDGKAVGVNNATQTGNGETQTKTFNLPTGWLPDKTSGKLVITLTTKKIDTEEVIGTSSATVTVKVPSTFVPSISSGAITLQSHDGKQFLVHDRHKIKVSIDKAKCYKSTGSDIVSYAISGPGITETISADSDKTSVTSKNNITISSKSVTTLTYTLTITDQRGRTASQNASIPCYPYHLPSFKSFNAYRSDENGNPSINGQYLYCVYDCKCADVGGNNDIVKVEVVYKNITGNTNEEVKTLDTEPIDLKNTTNSYAVYAIATDAYGGTATSNTVNVFGDFRVLNISKDGTGFAIGKTSKSSKLFECTWDAEFGGSMSLGKPLAIENGGTNATTSLDALDNLKGLAIINALSVSDDMDTYLTQGAHVRLYKTNSNTLNTPYKAGLTTFYSALILSYATSKPSDEESGYGKQIAVSSGGHIWEREMDAGEIGEWYKLGTKTVKSIVSDTVVPGFTNIDQTTTPKYKSTLGVNKSKVFTTTNQTFITARFALTPTETISAGTKVTLGTLNNYKPPMNCAISIWQDGPSTRQYRGFIDTNGDIIFESNTDLEPFTTKVDETTSVPGSYLMHISTSYVT